MAIHSSILAWRIPWTEEPGRLQSMGSQRVSDTTEVTWHTARKSKLRVARFPQTRSQSYTVFSFDWRKNAIVRSSVQSRWCYTLVSSKTFLFFFFFSASLIPQCIPKAVSRHCYFTVKITFRLLYGNYNYLDCFKWSNFSVLAVYIWTVRSVVAQVFYKWFKSWLHKNLFAFLLTFKDADLIYYNFIPSYWS